MARAVGLDIGSRTIKVVELNGSPKAFKVQRVVVRELPRELPVVTEGETPPDPDEVASGIVREIFESLKLPRDDVCVALDAGGTIMREIIVPFHDDDQIRKVVKFEAENHLHSHSIEDVIVNWLKTGSSRDGSRLTVLATPKEHIARQLAIIRGAGIEPASIDLDATAVYSACDAAGVLAEHPNNILLNVGARSTSLTLVVEGRPVVVRSFMLGADTVGARVSDDLQVPRSEGERRTRLEGGPRADDLLASAGDLLPPESEADKSLEQIQTDAVVDHRLTFVQKLHREAIRSLASLQSEATPELILLTGGGSMLPGLAEALHERFQLPVEPLDLSKYIEWKDQGTDPEATRAATAPAVGCGLRLLGHNPLGVELLKEEYAPTNRFDVLKTALATLVTLLFCVMLGLAFVATQRRDAEKRRFTYVAGKAATLFQTADVAYRVNRHNETDEAAKVNSKKWINRQPQDHSQIRGFRNRLLREYEDLQSLLGFGDIRPPPSGLEVWLEVIRALNGLDRAAYGPWLRIVKLDVKQRTATVRLEVDEPAAWDKIKSQFEKSEYFKNRAKTAVIVERGAVQMAGQHQQRDFDFRFKEED